jgi:hypothetical protein
VEGYLKPISRRISIRGLQVMGAICLGRFCDAQYIRHKSIKDYLKYLWKIATVESVSAWEQEGLERSRFGKAMALAEKLEEPLRSDYVRLLDRVLEIGKYGAPDRRESRQCLAEVIEIVRRYGVAPPEPTLFEKSPPGMQGWGRPVWAESVRKWKELA